MKWKFRTVLRLTRHDLGIVYDEFDKNLGTALFAVSYTHHNCSVNHSDLRIAYYLKIDYVLFQNMEKEQHLDPFVKAIELYKAGDRRDGSEYTVIPWQQITGEFDLPPENVPF